jgi:hypothetical protein
MFCLEADSASGVQTVACFSLGLGIPEYQSEMAIHLESRCANGTFQGHQHRGQFLSRRLTDMTWGLLACRAKLGLNEYLESRISY